MPANPNIPDRTPSSVLEHLDDALAKGQVERCFTLCAALSALLVDLSYHDGIPPLSARTAPHHSRAATAYLMWIRSHQ